MKSYNLSLYCQLPLGWMNLATTLPAIDLIKFSSEYNIKHPHNWGGGGAVER